MDFPINIDTVESLRHFISFSEVRFCLSKQCRSRLNVAIATFHIGLHCLPKKLSWGFQYTYIELKDRLQLY